MDNMPAKLVSQMREWYRYLDPSPKWPILCRVGRLTLVYLPIPIPN